MARFLRKATALVAVYAFVVQALLVGLALAVHAGFDPSSEICLGQNSADEGRGGAPAHHDTDCGACVLACGASPAIPATFDKVIFPYTSSFSNHLILWLEPAFTPAKHEPHASRAPPIDA